ncbi:MAG: MBL fold metallo-hydrolase [Anaerolineae bacterium]|nr:MBL fold metallo-hydrolase [Anaerolineae bacterium]
MQELAPNVFVETGFRRVNVGAILTDDGFVLIDTPPYPIDAIQWRDMLADLSEKPILAIVNTDYHRDRIIGNCWFGTRVVVSHSEAISYIQNLPSSFLDSAVETLTSSSPERNSFVGMRLITPTIGFDRRMQLRYGRRTIPLLAMPGPTAGSIWVHLSEQRIVFTGDSVIANQHPYISGPHTKSWLDNLTLLRRARFSAEIIVSGRGTLTSKSATEPISNYLRLARRRVFSLYRAGHPRADTAALVPELLDMFPYAEENIDIVQRRIKTGLDRIYEEFKAGEKTNDIAPK